MKIKINEWRTLKTTINGKFKCSAGDPVYVKNIESKQGQPVINFLNERRQQQRVQFQTEKPVSFRGSLLGFLDGICE